MLKKIILFALVGIVILLVGAGAGIFLGGKILKQPKYVTSPERQVEMPGPMVNMGDFTVNLADREPKIVRFKLVLELNSPKALNLFSESGWQSRVKNEVILAMKIAFYDDLRTAEGILEASQDLTRRINAMMPLVDGRAPVKRVLFEEFMLNKGVELMVPEVLSQAEIDALLQALSGHVDIEAIKKSEEEKKFKVYDFRQPDKFSKDQLRKRSRWSHESFARQVTTAISTMARSLVSAEVASVDQISYDEFVRSLVQPTVIAVLDMYPLSGSAMRDRPEFDIRYYRPQSCGKGNRSQAEESHRHRAHGGREGIHAYPRALGGELEHCRRSEVPFVNLEQSLFVQICPVPIWYWWLRSRSSSGTSRGL